jgi:glycosyltransferase involved in cell wall biosynthesis
MSENSAEPSVSILMPVKNAAHYLPQSIENIEKNVSPGHEIVIIDDASVDSTNAILKKWARKNSAVNVVKGPGSGITNALMAGLNICSSDWVARFDVDDQYSPNRIAQQVRSIRPKTVAIFSDYKFQSERGAYSGSMPTAVFPQQTKISLLGARRTPHPVAIFHREAALSVGGYLHEDFFAEDLSLWMRLSHVGNLTTIPWELLNYRISRRSITSNNQSIMKMNRDRLVETFAKSRLNSNEVSESLHNLEETYGEIENSQGRIFHSMIEHMIYFTKIQNHKSNKEIHWIRRKLQSPKYSQELIKYISFAGLRKFHRLFG